MKILRYLLALMFLVGVASSGYAQKPPINGVAGPTTSAQLKSIISDATGSGALNFGAGGGSVTSVGVATPSSTLTLGGTNPVTVTGTINIDIDLTHANTWAGQQTFVAPVLGTPASGVATNLTGTAASLTAGHVTTNANLTGVITSSGNVTSIASQTGTGTKFVMDTSPVLVTPNLGTPSAAILTNATALPAASVVVGALNNGMTATTQSPLDGTTKVATNAYADASSAAAVALAVPTGTTLMYAGSTAPTGWVLMSGLTIGSSTSGATGRANTDTTALYTLLWNTYSNTICPVSGGRGGSAAADFAANKTLTLLDGRGRFIAGADAMGGTPAGRLGSGSTGGVTGSATIGVVGGEQSHTLSSGEQASMSVGGSTGAVAMSNGGTAFAEGGGTIQSLVQEFQINYGTTSISGTATGGGGGHNNTPPVIVMNTIIKL